MDVDWAYGEQHMWSAHRVTVEQAMEAIADPEALIFDPDPKSRSGKSARLIGYSTTTRSVLVVIVVRREPGLSWWGANGWRANPTDRRTYEEGAKR